MFKIKRGGFTLMEMIISLFLFGLVFFMFDLAATLVKDTQKVVAVTENNQRVDQVFLQLDHYIQRSAFIDITHENGPYRLVLYHVKAKAQGETRSIALKQINGQKNLVLQNYLSQGYAPLLEDIEHVRFKREKPYIDMELTIHQHHYRHRFYCPNDKVSQNA